MKSFGVRRSVLGALFVGAACGGGAETPAGPATPTNEPPVIPSYARVADHDLEYRVRIVASDPEGDSVRLRLTAAPPWLGLDTATGVLFGTPGETALGTTPLVRIRAEDARGAVTTRSDTLRVRVGVSRLDPRGAWVGWTPHTLYHDGNPVESPHFVVHSGYSSTRTRERLSALLEERFEMLMERLGARESDAEFPPDGRLHVFADKLQADAAFGASSTTNGWAFPHGNLVMAEDAPRFRRQGYTVERWEGLVTHELMHNVEFLLNGRHVPVTASDVWFREGIATYMAGLAPGGVPLESIGLPHLNAWRGQMSSVPGGGNPIGVHLWADFPAQIRSSGSTASYYLWFAMTVQYVAHDDGMALGDRGLRGFYEDLRAGKDFSTSFFERTGITLETFETEWWSRMEEFLS